MKQTLPFNEHVAEYEEWFHEHPYVFQSELTAIKDLLPDRHRLDGLEIGTGTGRFAEALGIMEAVEPADNMRLLAIKRGINVKDAEAEHLPYHDQSFDFVVMAFSICYFNSLRLAFKEAHRVLKQGGALVIGFLDKDSIIGRDYAARKASSLFYNEATFYAPEKVMEDLKGSDFHQFSISQTLFGSLNDINELQPPKEGFGEGSFVLIKAIK